MSVKIDTVCGNSTVNNADCFISPYPSFIVNSASASAPSPASTPDHALIRRIPYRNTTTTSTTVLLTPVPTTSKSISRASPSVPPTSGVEGMFVPIGGVWGTLVVMVFGLL